MNGVVNGFVVPIDGLLQGIHRSCVDDFTAQGVSFHGFVYSNTVRRGTFMPLSGLIVGVGQHEKEGTKQQNCKRNSPHLGCKDSNKSLKQSAFQR